MSLRIEDRHVVGGIFRRAEQRTVSIHRGKAPVGGNQIVQIVLLRTPFPRGDHNVALDALRPLRLVFWQLALLNALRPIGEIFEGRAAELSCNAIGHHRTGLAGVYATHPGFLVRFEFAERFGNRARGKLAELVTADAVHVVHLTQPVIDGNAFRDAALATEFAQRRNLHHRVPIGRGIILGRRPLIGGNDGSEIELLTGLGVHFLRVDQSVASHPDFIGGARQIRNDVAPLIVGHHHLGVFGGEVGRFRDHPDACFRPFAAAHHPADVVLVDRNRNGPLLAADRRGGNGNKDRPEACRYAQIQ